MADEAGKPKAEEKDEQPRVKLPTYILAALASAAVALAGAAATVWNNSSLHATQIAIIMRDQDRMAAQIEALKVDQHATSVKVAKVERETDEFSSAALEKLDEVLKGARRR